MIRELAFKPDFASTIDRFAAWWQRDCLDRPPVTLHVRGEPAPPPESEHASLRERWLDMDFQLAWAIRRMERTRFLGDSFPAFMPNIGPELSATLLGCDLDFSETTSWSKPILSDLTQWQEVIGAPLAWENPYWQAVEQGTRRALERAQEGMGENEARFIVAASDLHDNYDVMAALRDPQMLCMDILDDPELIERVGRDLARVLPESFERLAAPIRAAGMGSTTWTRFYHEGPAYIPSCDFWCMIGPGEARNLVLPDLRTEMAPMARSLFHLDGPQALRHLDLLFEIEDLDAVQWVYGAGGGPASAWLEVYRRCREAGKSIHVVGEAEDLLTILEALGPKGIWLEISRPFDTEASGTAYLQEVARMSRTGRKALS